MIEIIKAAGWPIYPLIFASIVAVAIIVERLWALRYNVVAPSNYYQKYRHGLPRAGSPKKHYDDWKNIRSWAKSSPVPLAMPIRRGKS